MKHDGRFGAGRFAAGRFSGLAAAEGVLSASVSGIINNPTYGTTAQIGTVLTGTLNNLVGGEVIVHRWRTSAGLIAGANAATYAVALGGNVTDAGNIWYSPTVDASEVNSAVYTVRHAAPTLASSITDKLYEIDEAIPNFDATAHFGGAGATYAFAPASALVAGLSISGAGLLTGTPTALVAAAAVIIRCTNSGGYADAGFQITVADVPDRMDPPAVVTTGTMTISVDRASTPANNNSPIDLYQARWRAAPSGSWTTVSDIADPDTLTGLPSDTLIDVQTRCRNAIGFGSWSLSASDTTDAPTGDAAVDYGALTLAGHGGLALPAGAASITNAGGTNLEVSTGMVVPAAGGGVSSGTVVFNNGTEWTVTALADTYHITGTTHANNAEFDAARDAAVAGTGLAGKTFKGRSGAKLGALNIYQKPYSGTVTIEGEDPTTEVIGGLLAGNSTAGNVEFKMFSGAHKNEVAPSGNVFDFYLTGGTVLFEDVLFEGLFDPIGQGWDEFDFMATITVSAVTGGALAVGNHLRGDGLPVRVHIQKITDNLDGTFKLWLGDNVGGNENNGGGFQDTAKDIAIGDTLTAFASADGGTETGVVCTSDTVATSTVKDYETANNIQKLARNIIVQDQDWGEMTLRRVSSVKGGRLYAGNGGLWAEDILIDTFAGDGFNPGVKTAADRRRVVLLNVDATGCWSRGDFFRNDHADLLQLRGAGVGVGDWENIRIENVVHWYGTGVADCESLFFETDNVKGAVVRNCVLEGGLNMGAAEDCTVENVICGRNWDQTSGITYSKLHVGSYADGGGNVVERCASGFFDLAGATTANNVSLVADNYDDAFAEAEPWANATATRAETLTRYRPKDGGDMYVGGHSGPWVHGSDTGCIDETGAFVPYSDATGPGLSSTAPADDATGVAVDANLSMTFSEDIAFGTGNIVLRENNGGWVDLEAFDVTTDTGGGAGAVSISGNVLTVEPTSDFVSSREYAVRVAGTAIDDLSGNSYAGIADDTTFSFTSVSASFVAQGIDMSSSGLTEYPIAAAGQFSASEKKLLLSFWVYVPTTWVVYGNLVAYKAGNAERITVVPVSASRLGLLVYNDASVVIGQLTTSVDAMAVDTWHHLLISYDSTSGGSGLQLTVNGVPAALGTNVQPATDDLLPSGVNKFQIHDYQPGNPHYIAEYYEYIGQSLDLTVPANVEKFRDATGDPVSLGADGSVPLGSAPTRYMSGSAATWNVDKANGRTLTVAGSALAAAPSNPGG